MSDTPTLPADEAKTPFTLVLEYIATLKGNTDAERAVPQVFSMVYTSSLLEFEREIVLKAVSTACGVTLGALKADWKAFVSTRPEEQGRALDMNQADRLVHLLLERLTLFHDADGHTYADLDRNGHRETYRLRGKTFKELMAREFYEAEGKAPSSQGINDALGVLEGKAKFDGPEHRVFVRIAPLLVGDSLRMFLDLGDPDWQVVEVDSSGWRLVTNPPVRFRRPKTLQALLTPVMGGEVSDLLEALNIAADSFHMLACWLVGALNPRGPYALLELIGGQGTSKSTTAKFIKRLIDPSSADLRTVPRSEEDMMIAAQGQHTLCYDNLSDITGWLSDALSRLATGGGLSKRELYSDDDEITLEAMRPVILTGITELATKPDLLDRTLRIELPLIPPDKRRPVAEVEATFARVAPRVLGALLSAVSMALRDHAQVAQEIGELPRMADFAVWVTAAEPALGVARGQFIAEYNENRAQSDNAALESDPVPLALVEMMKSREEWTGTPIKLLAKLEDTLPRQGRPDNDGKTKPQKPKGWPKLPKELTAVLRRFAPVLRSVGGVAVIFEKRTKDGWPLRILRVPIPDKEGELHTSRTPRTPERAEQQKSGVHGGAHGGVPAFDVHPTYTPTYTEENTVPVGENSPLPSDGVPDVCAQLPLSEWMQTITEEWSGDA